MTHVDERVARTLHELAPISEQAGDWEAVMQNATAWRRWGFRAAPFAAALTVVAAVLLAWPFGGGKPGGILDRALAAIGDGPVLHAVFREEWGGALVEIGTGERRKLRAEREVWYDPDRGLHMVSRLEGSVHGDTLYPRERVPRFEAKTYAFLGAYRDALESRKARVLEPGEVDGIPVYWIRVDEEWLPDVADNRLHEWAHDVAVSQESYEPVATRETRDRKPGPIGTRSRILSFETLPAGEGDFTEAPSLWQRMEGTGVMRGGWMPITPVDAAGVLSETPVWLGERFRGLPLAGIGRTEFGARRRGEDRWTRTSGVVFFYGKLTGEGLPDYTHPHVSVQQVDRLYPAYLGVEYIPPEGSAVVSGSTLFTRSKGLYVEVFAAMAGQSDEAALAAARVLRPMPK